MPSITLPVKEAPAITMPPESLPDHILTPRERAWDTLRWLEAHPQQWNQGAWAEWHTSGLFRRRTYFRGCFASITCLRAGLTILGGAMVDSVEAPELASHPMVHTSGPREGMIHVKHAAAAFYNLGEATMEKLVHPDNSMVLLKWHVLNIFGYEPSV